MYPETGFAVAKHQTLGTKAANLAISNTERDQCSSRDAGEEPN